MSQTSHISVIVPSFNRRSLISETLGSVLDQTYSDWECIIVDDGSTDGTQDVIQTYTGIDPRFRFVQRNSRLKGASVCRNIGIEKSKGDYIVFLDSDDILSKDCLQNRIRKIRDSPGNDFWVFRSAMFVNTPDEITGYWNILNKDTDDLFRFIIQDTPWCVSGPIWRSESIKKIGGFDESAICWQDWELHVRALLSGLNYYKAGDSACDHFYRKNSHLSSNAINKNQLDPLHMAFRINLFEKVYKETVATRPFPWVSEAFSVLYCNLFRELYAEHYYPLLREFYRSVSTKGIFSRQELFYLKVLSLNLRTRYLNYPKHLVFSRLISGLRKDWFSARPDTTFQQL